MPGSPPSSAGDDDSGVESDIEIVPPSMAFRCSGRTKRTMSLTARPIKCGVYCYTCSVCALRFPTRNFVKMDLRDHVGDFHTRFLSYRCHATQSAHSKFADHALYPDLLGTNMTDKDVKAYRRSARRMSSESKTFHEFQLPYVDVLLVEEDAHVFACAQCSFSSRFLEDFRRHAVSRHVLLTGFVSQPEAKDTPLPVLGPPHQL